MSPAEMTALIKKDYQRWAPIVKASGFLRTASRHLMNSVEEKAVSAGPGAEISGIDLRRPLSDEALHKVRQALNRHGVIFFRDQLLTPEQHIAFAERFGKITLSQAMEAVSGYPSIAEVRKEPDETENIGGYWHTDQSYDEAPALGSILLAREVPEQGGDTLFANTAAAYEALSEGLKKTLHGLRAVHSNRVMHAIYAKKGARARGTSEERSKDLANVFKDIVHPVVIRHPDSGRKTLYVNPYFTVHFEGWTQEESAPLLSYLHQHVTKPEFTFRFHWKRGSIAFWDNRATWHYAVNDYHGNRRVMHRITVRGVPLTAADAMTS
jgi:taurine dioxygenase